MTRIIEIRKTKQKEMKNLRQDKVTLRQDYKLYTYICIKYSGLTNTIINLYDLV